jgi:hypothetical protein
VLSLTGSLATLPDFNNLALKVNVKLQNGINSVLQPGDLGPIVETPTMVCGGDVSHASPGSPNPSVAAVVGSMDPTASIFGTAITVQPSRLELIAQLEAMMVKLLRQFYAKNHILPERIVCLRLSSVWSISCSSLTLEHYAALLPRRHQRGTVQPCPPG